ncbi:MAG: RagB/SusD family nutrient uptake outer membrane protein [Butyricimonas paravirosa]
MVSGKISSLFGSYIAEGDTPDTFVLRYAEVLLNKAEALVMLDREDEAIDVLKELLETRYENGIYPEITERGEDLVNLIRDERRRELCFEGHRWFDLRRYAVNPKYPLTDYKIIHGVYAEKPESGQAAQIGYCVLEMYPKGKGWILPIPEYEVNVNPEIGHNEREDAEYVEF